MGTGDGSDYGRMYSNKQQGMQVTAVIVSFNTEQHLGACVHTLLNQTYPRLNIVVVDNNSGDRSVSIAQRFNRRIKVIANWSNLGFAGAANQGIAQAPDHSGAVFICNPDVRLHPDHIAKLVARLESDPTIASVQGRIHRLDVSDGVDEYAYSPQTVPAQPIRDRHGNPIIDTTGHSAHRNRVFRNRGEGQPDLGQIEGGEVFGVSGCAALYRTEALHDIAINGEIFDEDFFAFFEDVDVDWRLRRRGWIAYHEPTAIALHERGGSGARRSAFVERLSYRNWFLTVLKNDDWQAIGPDAHLLGATTFLRTADLAFHVPTAFLGAIKDSELVGKMLLKRNEIQSAARISNRQIIDQWFGPFDYADWIRRRLQRKRRAIS
ncbi:glycosyltransferase family 2 protein [Stomatohabitans albus]|uniref:glycosyltransferase family 2 protein n=1 Tax=Stomatohabitans albus TaxID=3110766 RepID=UPI00300C1A02